jgi:cell division protease FtsH
MNQPTPKAPNMRKNIAIVAILLIGYFVFQFFIGGGTTPEISYSTFKKALIDGRIQQVSVSTTEIRGVMKDKEIEKQFSTIRVDDPELTKLLESKNVQYSGKIQSNFLSNLLWIIIPFALLYFFFMRQTGGAGTNVLSFGKSRAKLNQPLIGKKISFKDVAGVDEAKEELQEVVDFLKTPQRFQQLGGRIPRGILLIGAPGTGKTLLARAVAGEAGVPFFSISGSEFVEMFVGVGAARVRDLFAQAMSKAPCIVFIDELDALGRARGFSPVGGFDEREQTLNQLLTEMDGFDTRVGIIIMAATNRPEILDSALMRPGRFDRQVLVDRPDLVGREAILKVHSEGIKMAENVDLKTIAQRTPGFVGADLANIMNEAALLAARRNKTEVMMDEFSEAIDRVVAGLEKKKRLISPSEKKIVAYHEAGHAIVSHFSGKGDEVHKISIIPRGIAALGYTINLPTEDRYLMTQKELEARLATLLGGRVAEELFIQDVSTGASSDLMKATEIAKAMVKEYGMSSLGLSSYERPSNPFLKDNSFFPSEKDYSEKVAAQIDEEVKNMLIKAHDKAVVILNTKKQLMEDLSKLLLEKEVVEKDEFIKLMTEEKLEELPRAEA